MIGAIIGDIAGSRFEFNNVRSKNFALLTDKCFFTDDTVCTVAVADALMNGKDYAHAVAEWCRAYPGRGYGGMFARWIHNPVPYNSFGNGAVMRISPIPLLLRDLEEVRRQTELATAISHNHADGLRYADAVSVCIFNLKNGQQKDDAIAQAMTMIGVEKLPNIKHFSNPFDETIYNCVPAALHCLKQSTDFESAIREAILIGGDVDTIGACVGGMAESLYGVPSELYNRALKFLPKNIIAIIEQFNFYTHGQNIV